MRFNSMFCSLSSTKDLLQVFFVVQTPFPELSDVTDPTQLTVAFEVELFRNK